MTTIKTENAGASSDETLGDGVSPDAYEAVVAEKAALEEKIQTIIVPAMRERWRREAALIGMSAAEVLRSDKSKRRGRQSKKDTE